VGSEGVGGEGRREVTEDESGPGVGQVSAGWFEGNGEGDTHMMGGGSCLCGAAKRGKM
jgi:hypothetical protein